MSEPVKSLAEVDASTESKQPRSQSDGIKKLLGGAVSVIAFLIASTAAKTAVRDWMKPSVDAELIKAAELLEKQGPTKVAEYTTMVGASYSAKVFHYKYQLEFPNHREMSAEALETAKTKFNDHLLKNACANSDTRTVLKARIALSFDYVFTDGDAFESFKVVEDDCNKPG